RTSRYGFRKNRYCGDSWPMRGSSCLAVIVRLRALAVVCFGCRQILRAWVRRINFTLLVSEDVNEKQRRSGAVWPRMGADFGRKNTSGTKSTKKDRMLAIDS